MSNLTFGIVKPDAVRAGNTTKLLQTAGGPDWPFTILRPGRQNLLVASSGPAFRKRLSIGLGSGELLANRNPVFTKLYKFLLGHIRLRHATACRPRTEDPVHGAFVLS